MNNKRAKTRAAARRRSPTRTIRLRSEDYARLHDLAAKQQQTIAQVVADLVKQQEQQEFARRFTQSVERLRADPEAWADYRREFMEWENATVADGLETEEWTEADVLTPPRTD